VGVQHVVVLQTGSCFSAALKQTDSDQKYSFSPHAMPAFWHVDVTGASARITKRPKVSQCRDYVLDSIPPEAMFHNCKI
jgi:hypothetical protein